MNHFTAQVGKKKQHDMSQYFDEGLRNEGFQLVSLLMDCFKSCTEPFILNCMYQFPYQGIYFYHVWLFIILELA
jgi:hypothetical protein